MDAKAHNLEAVFGQSCRYVVPLFQRPYVWQEDTEWDPFWNDVRTVIERNLAGENPPPHFLGAVVLEQVNTPTGTLQTRHVIDGQQRFTTLQILLAALRDICAEGDGGEKHVLALEKLVTNDDPYLEDNDHRFKVWPTNTDRDAYRSVMTARSPKKLREHFDAPGDAPRVGHRLADAYLYFHRTISEWLGNFRDGREEVLRTTVMSLRGSLLFVVIDLHSKDDPQIIFETLNARGTPLLAADLVKNYLFHIAERGQENVDKLYLDYWQPFDRDSAFWREEVRQGRLKHPRINIFLQYYLSLHLKRETPAAQTFLAFRRMTSETSPVTSIMKDLARYGKVYRQMHDFPQSSPEGVFFHRLALMDTSTVMPFLMDVFAKLGANEQADERREVLRILESFLVRRLVCNLTVKNYNKLFLDLLGWTEAQGMSASAIRSFLLAGDGPSLRWPTDAEFAQAWRNSPLYKQLVRSRLRMILEAIETNSHSKLTEQVSLPEKLTIEHLLPQAWKEHWPLPDITNVEERAAAISRREENVHRIGNLTLLTKSLNPKLSNAPWDKKREGIRKHSALNLNRYFDDVEVLDEAAIAKRSDWLLEVAQRIWPHPQPERTHSAHEMLSEPPSASEEESVMNRVRENLREIVAELAGPEPVDFIERFTKSYPEDVRALGEYFRRTPEYGALEFLMEELAGILRSDPNIRFDPEHAGYIRRVS